MRGEFALPRNDVVGVQGQASTVLHDLELPCER